MGETAGKTPACPRERWVALGKFLGEFVYLAVEICHRLTLLSATPSFQVRKNFENRQKHHRRRSAWVGQADFGKLELNNRNHSGNCQRLVMNVIHLKHDQFKINAVEFSDLREEASTRLSFAMHFKFFSKTLFRQGLHSHINLRYFKVFTGTSSIEGEPVEEFPSTQANTSQVCYSPSQMHYSHPSTFWSSLSVPSS